MLISPRRRTKLKALAAGLLLTAAVTYYFAPEADSAYTLGLRPVFIKEDAFTNYDFLERQARRYNVDWPIGIIYKGHAEVDKIKWKFRPIFPFLGSTKHALVDEGAGWRWDKDRGIKDSPCRLGNNVFHSRLYAPHDDSLFNTRMGFYVLASAHIDHSECAWGTWFGNSEYAEFVFVGVAAALWGPNRIRHDWISLNNFEYPARWEGNHYWNNNGAASIVVVP